MRPLSSFRLVTLVASCAVLLGCAGTAAPENSRVARTLAPKDFEKTITSYFAFRMRGPQTNTVINFAPPEPGECGLDGYLNSIRGWVVPVVYSTRSGQGLSRVDIDAKQYYFWFLGNTIAGITPRRELCPGVGANLTELSPPILPAGGFAAAVFAAPPEPVAERREPGSMSAPPPRSRSSARPKASSAQKQVGHATRRSATSTSKASRSAQTAERALPP